MRDEFEKEILKERINTRKLLKIIPELMPLKNCTQKHPAHCYKVLKHSIKVTEGVPKELIYRIVGIFHDTGKPESKVITDDGVEHFWEHPEKSVIISKKILHRLGYDEKFIEKVSKIIEVHDIKIDPSQEGIKSVIGMIGKENFEILLVMQRADLQAHSKSYIEKKIYILDQLVILYKNMK